VNLFLAFLINCHEIFNKFSTASRGSIRMSAVQGHEMLRAPIILETVKFRTLSINGDLHHTYLGDNIFSVPEQRICTASQRGSQERACLQCVLHITLIKKFMSKE
jgi:hypothetical protein